MSLSEKLHPSRFTAMSGKMSAILGFVLGESWTEPKIAELDISADGYLLARISSDIGHNDFIGALSDWDNNLRRLFEVAEVTPEEREEFSELWRTKVTDWRYDLIKPTTYPRSLEEHEKEYERNGRCNSYLESDSSRTSNRGRSPRSRPDGPGQLA